MSNEKIQAELEKYEADLKKTTAKFPLRPNVPEQGLYTPLDVEGGDYAEDLGIPGQFPYTRGVQPTMYRGRFWTMRMYAGFSTAEESNKRYRMLIATGASGLSCAFDLPTQIGYDSDDSISEGEVGKVGVAIDSLADMETLFDQIDLGKVSTSMTINAPASVLLAMYIAVAEKQGVPADQLTGTIQNDILKEYAARGTYIFPPRPSMRLITNIFAYCSKNVPKWNTISISGYHFAGRLSFFWNAHNNVLEEVAKYRASRRIWAKIMRDRFGAKKDKSMKLRFHTQTAGSMLTAQQPDNNIVRVALQTAAAVMGGTQSLHTNSRDEALALPTEESVSIALHTQHIVAHESGLADVIDPLAGSYYVEAMTNRIEKEAMEYIKKIDEMGGAVAAIEKGYIQKEIQDSAYAWQMDVESGARVIVGVNKYQKENEEPPKDLLKVDASVGEKQKKQLAEVKAKRDNAAVKSALEALKNACEDEKENLMPHILTAVKTYATLGEICGVMRSVFGEYEAHTSL